MKRENTATQNSKAASLLTEGGTSTALRTTEQTELGFEPSPVQTGRDCRMMQGKDCPRTTEGPWCQPSPSALPRQAKQHQRLLAVFWGALRSQLGLRLGHEWFPNRNDSESGAVSGGAGWCQELCECSSKECFLPPHPPASGCSRDQAVQNHSENWVVIQKPPGGTGLHLHTGCEGKLHGVAAERVTCWEGRGSKNPSAHPWPKANSSALRRGENRNYKRGITSPGAKAFLLLLCLTTRIPKRSRD